MPTKTFDVNLDLMNSEYQLIDGIEVVSGDTEANVFNINLLKDYQPVNVTGNTAVIVFLKPDNTTVYQNLTLVDAAAGKFTCTLSAQTIIIPGRVRAEVILYEGTKRLTSTRFEFIVRKSLLNENTVESSNEFTALTEALGTVNQYDSRITTVEQDQAAHEAEKATQNELGHIKLQEPWITATLQNGWTGTLQYAKNELGQVCLKGQITPGAVTTGSVISSLPSGYRPTQDVSMVIYETYTGRGVIGITLLQNGSLLVYPPASTTLTTNAIRINAIFSVL
jgi:hypothetical protein